MDRTLGKWGFLIAAASLASRHLMRRGVSSAAIRNTVIAGMAALVLALFVFLPFCLGSAAEGTYDCIPLATRLMNKLR